jgi:phosphosulfolactate synthase (CoM biosynthesis protein A)
LLSLLILGQTTQSVISEATDYVPKYAIGWGTLAFINAGLAQAVRRRSRLDGAC